MESTDLTITVLREIRDEVKRVNERVDRTNDEIAAMRGELGTEIAGLGKRLVDSEVRTATAITGLAGAIYEVRDLLR